MPRPVVATPCALRNRLKSIKPSPEVQIVGVMTPASKSRDWPVMTLASSFSAPVNPDSWPGIAPRSWTPESWDQSQSLEFVAEELLCPTMYWPSALTSIASPTDRLFLLIRDGAPLRHCTPRR